MKKLTSIILAAVFAVSIALAVINTTFATQTKERGVNYALTGAMGPKDLVTQDSGSGGNPPIKTEN